MPLRGSGDVRVCDGLQVREWRRHYRFANARTTEQHGTGADDRACTFLYFRRCSQTAGAAHGGPVVLVGGATEDAYLVIPPMRADVRPGKLVLAESLGEPG